MSYLYGSEKVLRWASHRFGKKLENATTIGRLKDGKIIGAAVFNNYTGEDIELSYYGPGAMTREFIMSTFRYIFDQLRCVRCTIRCRPHHKKLFQKFGFRTEGRLRRHYGDQDAIIMGMLRQECRWLEDKNVGDVLSTEGAGSNQGCQRAA